MRSKPTYEELEQRVKKLEREALEVNRVERALRESEARLQTAVGSLPFDFFLIDADGRYAMQNAICKKHWGDIVGKRPEDVAPDKEILALWQSNNRRALAGEVVEDEVSFYRRGEEIHNLNIVSPIRDGYQIRGILGVNIDITERKCVEENLRESEERFRAIFEGSLDAIFLADPESGRILDANPAAEELLLRPHEGIVGLHYTQLHPSRLRESAKERFTEGVLDRQVRPFETKVLRSDGSEKPVEILGQLIQIDGVPVFYGTFRDISERKLAEKKLKESINTWRVTFNIVPVLALMVDNKGCILEANKVFAQRFGKHVDEIIGISVFDLLPPDVAQHRRSHFDQVIHSGQPARFEDENYGRWLVTIVCPILDEEGKVIKVALLARDITETKRAEEALRESERMYRTFVRTSPDAVLVADVDGQITEVSQQWVEMFGYSSPKEVVGRSGFEQMAPEDHEKARRNIQKTIQEGYTRDQEYTLLRKDGSPFIGEMSAVIIKDEHGTPKSLMISIRDVTEQKRITEELIKAQKLESLGILAGGIAHDFNNILTAITTNISMAKIFGDLPDDVSKMLTDAEIASERAKNLTQQLLTFAKGGTPIKKPFLLSRTLRDTSEFALSGSNLRCDYRISKDLWTVAVDEGQISQVIQNLVVNAKQAMPEGGVIKLSAENVVLSKKDLIPLKVGEYVKITVRDQGKGIPETHLQRIFDPFFTTKHHGRGLGLAIAFSIVKNHGGHINVASKTGCGTTFYVYLPAFQKAIKSKEKEKEKPLGGEGKILLVDDNEFVRRSAGHVLKRLGYDVEFAKDGAEGIRLYERAKEANQPFDVVIMDLTIPGGMGGKEAIKELREIDPQAKVIVSSGYSDDKVMSKFRKYGFSGILTKPYKIEEVDEAIRKVMKGAS